MLKNKKIIIIIIFGLFIYFSNSVIAYSLPSYSLGSAKLVHNFQVFINGKKIENSKKEIILETNKPILFGYAISNVNIEFVVKTLEHNFSDKHKTITDNNGYWVYYFDKELMPGKYEIFMKMYDDVNNISSSSISSTMFQIGTFSIPNILPKISKSSNDRFLIPTHPLNSLNYFTVTLIIVGLVIFKIIFYFIIRIIYPMKKTINYKKTKF